MNQGTKEGGGNLLLGQARAAGQHGTASAAQRPAGPIALTRTGVLACLKLESKSEFEFESEFESEFEFESESEIKTTSHNPPIAVHGRSHHSHKGKRLMKTFDVHEAALFLKVHVDTVREGARSGKIPGAKVGRAWVFLETDLAQYLRTQYAKALDSEGNPWGAEGEKSVRTVDRSPFPYRSQAATDRAYRKALGLPPDEPPGKPRPTAADGAGARRNQKSGS